MANAATHIFTQLKQLDPGWYRCTPYSAFAANEQHQQHQGLASFIHPALAEDGGKLLSAMIQGAYKPSNAIHGVGSGSEEQLRLLLAKPTVEKDGRGREYTLPNATVMLHLAEFQSRLNMIDSMCDGVETAAA
jgi:hypothetical protein